MMNRQTLLTYPFQMKIHQLQVYDPCSSVPRAMRNLTHQRVLVVPALQDTRQTCLACSTTSSETSSPVWKVKQSISSIYIYIYNIISSVIIESHHHLRVDSNLPRDKHCSIHNHCLAVGKSLTTSSTLSTFAG